MYPNAIGDLSVSMTAVFQEEIDAAENCESLLDFSTTLLST